jgi:hypothetical protein
MKRIFTIMLLLNVLLFGEMTRANNIVTDSVTNLQWQDKYTDDIIVKTTWEGAIGYCDGLVLSGLEDWRLPNINELTSLVDFERNTPSIDPVFQYTNASTYSNYWSSTSNPGSENYALKITFENGTQSPTSKGALTVSVRCVRAGN